MAGTAPQESVPAEAIRAHLEKVVSSRAFANAGRSSRFLRFIVEERLAGHLDRIQEYVLGLEVFDRKESFDPRVDSIVRVEGRRLRIRLDEYYRTEGRGGTMRIALPKRGYIPEFRTVETPKRPVHLFWGAGVLAFLALITSAVYLQNRRHGERAATSSGFGSIGVLPFVNLSGDPNQEYLVDGITDALITELARIPSLRVISRTSVMRHKASNESAPAIARELGARYLLEGAVTRSGHRVRLTAQLIDGAKDEHIWAQSYDREITDVLRLQSELALQVAREIRIQLAPEIEKSLVEAPAVREKALDAYLKGRFALNQRTAEAAARSARFFEEAVAEEPDFALAHAWLAAAYRTSVVWGDAPASEMLRQATASARKAVDLNPRLAEAHSSLAVCHSMEWNWREAKQEFLRALELGPRNSEAHHRYAILYLAPVGRLDEAETEIRVAVKLDRTSLNNRVILGKILYFQRKYDQATAELEEVLKMDPDYPDGLRNLGAVYVQRGMFEQAVAAYEKAHSLAPSSWGEGLLAHGLAVSGRRRDAARNVQALVDRGRSAHISPHALAVAFVGLGSPDQALQWMQRARVHQDWQLIFLKVDPIYDSLRRDPRFQSLVKTMGLD